MDNENVLNKGVKAWLLNNGITNTEKYFQTPEGERCRLYLAIMGIEIHDSNWNNLTASEILRELYDKECDLIPTWGQVFTVMQCLAEIENMDFDDELFDWNSKPFRSTKEDIFTNTENEELDNFINEFRIVEA